MDTPITSYNQLSPMGKRLFDWFMLTIIFLALGLAIEGIYNYFYPRYIPSLPDTNMFGLNVPIQNGTKLP